MIQYQVTVYTKKNRLAALDTLGRTWFANVDGTSEKDLKDFLISFIAVYFDESFVPRLVHSGDGNYRNLGRNFPSKLWTYAVSGPDGGDLQHKPREKEKPPCCLQCDETEYRSSEDIVCRRTTKQLTKELHKLPDFCPLKEEP